MKAFKEAFQQEHLVLSLGLGLFIFLAGSQSLTTAWMMSLALWINVLLSTSILFVIRRYLTEDYKWIFIWLVSGSVATMVTMLAQAFVPGWVVGIELYLPFIALSGVILARVESVVLIELKYQTIVLNALGSGLGFALLIIPMGIMVEVLGQGTLSFASPMLNGHLSPWFEWTILPEAYRIPIFEGSLGAIGILIVAALWIALVRQIRGQRL